MFESARTFRCPNCNEMINDSMKQCPFCSVQVDPAIVSLMAERQEKANRAYNDGSFLKIAAIAMFVFLAVSLIPFLGVIYYGFLVTFVVVLFLLIRWQLTFGSLLTNDADYKVAKRSRNTALILWLAAVPLGFLIRPLLGLLISHLLGW